MKRCILCGQPTTGSIGAAGIRWTIICQSCKDAEDKALLNQLKTQQLTADVLVSTDLDTLN